MNMKILVIGISGMLGNAVFRRFSANKDYEVYGTLRSIDALTAFEKNLRDNIILDIDVENVDSLIELLSRLKPNVVINCVGLVKQLAQSADPLYAIPMNSIFPHRLAKILSLVGGRLIHVSTDCVFSGRKGMYRESDTPDATDIYGRTKLLGEVDYPNAITLRTSIIGHEIKGNRSLINWFLSQTGQVKGYSKAIFSGLPTVVLADVIRDYVIPNQNLTGLYHLSADPIDKYSLLKMVSEVYKKDVAIQKDSSLIIDRSLDSSRFRKATGFVPLPWLELIKRMNEFS